MPQIFAFGPFRLDAEAEILFRGAEPLPVGKRALTLLRVLLEQPGAPVSKDALIEAAWQGLAVEESNLPVQIGALRRTLSAEPGGEGWIETLPRRGYRFVGPSINRGGNSGVNEQQEATAVQDAAKREIDSPDAASPKAEPQRRQLSVMSCELAWAGGDLEDMHEAVTAYQNCLTGIVSAFKGFVAKRVGTTVLVYFGYPEAHENDAELAVRAGLALCMANPTVTVSATIPLRCRVGIATGLVIVGDLFGPGGGRSAIGEPPNIATRLQMSAQPGTVIIDVATQRLVGGLFDYDDAGGIEPGTGDRVQAWQVLGIGAVESRFDALRGSALPPFVGRDEELELLLRRWEQAKRSGGRVVLVTGEPGIGKSRLTRALNERLAEEPHARTIYHCSPHARDSALHPVIGNLLRSANIERHDDPQTKLAKLEALLAQSTKCLANDVALFATLLSIPGGDRFPLPSLTPHQLKERTLGAIIGHLQRLCAHQPILVVFEDAHWVDPTSLELLTRLVALAASLPLLVLVTARPEFAPPWSNERHISTVVLTRLGRTEVKALVSNIAAGKELPGELLNQITQRTDGIPLFVEELTKAILESGLLRELDDCYELIGPLPPLAIPPTLHASLLARLDRLASVKDVAQIGAAIGREFSYALIAAVAAMPDKNLCAALERLVDAELIFQRGVPPDAIYQFKHALVQDAAYGTLLRSRRQQLHGQIAQALEEQFPDVVASEPEVLAHHFTAAGLTERGVFYWQRAGQQANDRSAYLEAASHFNVGLELLNQLPDTPARAHQELALHVGLGAALLVTKGIAFPGVERSYLKARELCLRIGETPELAPILFGLWRYYNTRSRLETARELAEILLRLAEHDPSLTVVAHEALGCTAFWSGDFVNARQHLDEGIQRYSLSLPRAPVFQIGEDPGVGCHMYASSVLWFLGYPDQAAARMHGGLMMAGKLSRPYTLAFARVVAALCFQMRREVAATLDQAEAAVSLATEHGFPHWTAMGAILCGWALAMRDRSGAGMAKLSQGIAAWRGNDASVNAPYALAIQAEAASLVGHIDEGLRSLDHAQVLLDQHEDRWFEAEIYRLRGELLLRQSIAPEAEAETWFRRALDVARSQQAKSLELRAATRLAHLWHAQGKDSEARDLLSRVYGWFTEGFDTIDLKDAKALLAELSA
jgi:DNA-binding winged helix-turn-helix (wHTH) protein/class 3 adenylate cyclase/predicted ATPase